MADEPNTSTLQQSPPQPAAAPATTVPDDYEELKAFRDNYRPFLEKIAPVWEDISPLVDSDEEREYVRQARQARTRMLEEQKPKLTPELQRIRDEFATELQPVIDWAKAEKEAKQSWEQSQQQQAQQANLDYAKRLVAERPDFAEDNYAVINMLAQYAFRDKLSLEEAYKRNIGRFAGAAPKREPPPRSLSAGAAAPGIPGESTAPKAKTRKDFRARLIANMKGVK